ncbi:MAG: electron transfer flavoprotein subunit beta/FixA family protein [Gemmatimonadota bacterium]|nr:electron transfer flavoprotein subunit beta/FixA family protein [Gemmatimonadota bacterium]
MKIIVCIKQVPERDARLRIASDGKSIDETGLATEINESDQYALEAALRLVEEHGGEVVVACLGPDAAQESIRRALAMGADRAIHLSEDAFQDGDAAATARALAAAIETEEEVDLVMAGLQSDDAGWAQTGVLVAERLGWPSATLIMEIEAEEGGLKVKRELESGWFQWVRLPLPAVLTIQSGINTVRYATLKGIMGAKKKEIKTLSPDHLGLDAGDVGEAGRRIEIARLYEPEKTAEAEMIEGDDAVKAADVLVDRLQKEARVL